jgi:hypothetical protein
MTYTYTFDRLTKTEHYEVKVDTAALYGYFEHHSEGDNQAGGLWFERLEGGMLSLTDYDGMFELPGEVKAALLGMGFVVDEEF